MPPCHYFSRSSITSFALHPLPRTGCPECYGKLNCGCPDCYVPELKRGKKKSVTLSMVDMAHMPAILELEYSFCTVSQVMEEKATATKVSVRTQVSDIQGNVRTITTLVYIRRGASLLY